MGFKIGLGCKARDKVTGITGIVTSRTEHLYNCRRYGISQPADKEGKVPDIYAFDEDSLEVLESSEATGFAKPPATNGGPRTSERRETVKR